MKLMSFMDHKNLFRLKHLSPLMVITTIIILTFSLIKPALSADPQFEACEPKKCGENLTFRYPFWVSFQQPSYCGHQGLEIICKDDKPMVWISDEYYLVLDIFYQNQSVLVANAKAFDDKTCATPLHNITLFSDDFISFGPDQLHLFFFYNCTIVPPNFFTYSIPCAAHDHNLHTYAAFLQKVGLPYLNASSENCGSLIAAPVGMNEEDTPETLMKMSYVEVLKKGFLLEWNSSGCAECERSGGRCGFLNNDEFTCFCSYEPRLGRCKTGHKPGLKIGIGVAGGVGGILLACIGFFICLRRKKVRSTSSILLSRNISPDPSLKSDVEKGSMQYPTPIFKYDELEEATENFHSSKELGDGGFGTVYYGKLKDGRAVAVKRIYEHNYKRVEQFMNEINILSRLRHQHLVSLYGCTSRDSRELLLVFEFVPNGTVADHLHGQHAKAGSLTWPVRMNVAIESADALTYLHATEIIHRDVKTNNILLDKNFHVKVADFGLSRLFPIDVTHVSTAPQGTPGYVDPEYYQCYQLNAKSDVYSFGVVLIELISSKPAVDISRHRQEINLASMAINKILNHALHELVDPRLGFDTDYAVRRMITLVAELAFRCLQQEKEMRPSMKEVLECLRNIASDQYKETGEELDVPAEMGLLKGISPFSPDSVTEKWASISTTPNTSA